MLQKGLTIHDLQRGTGFCLAYVRRVAAGFIASKPARQKIEEFLGCPIWSEKRDHPDLTAPELEELRQARIAIDSLNLTPEDLAAQTGLSQISVSNILNGLDSSWPGRKKINEALGREIFTQHD